MVALWTVKAQYDPEAAVWYTIAGDMPGLLVDGETLEALAAKIAAVMPDLFEIHADDLTEAQRVGPHSVRIVAHHEHAFDVAA